MLNVSLNKTFPSLHPLVYPGHMSRTENIYILEESLELKATNIIGKNNPFNFIG